jgi:hypothetical protein
MKFCLGGLWLGIDVFGGFHRSLAPLVSLNSCCNWIIKSVPNSESSTGELTVTKDKALNLAQLEVVALEVGRHRRACPDRSDPGTG